MPKTKFKKWEFMFFVSSPSVSKYYSLLRMSVCTSKRHTRAAFHEYQNEMQAMGNVVMMGLQQLKGDLYCTKARLIPTCTSCSDSQKQGAKGEGFP